jgi:putative ABC transport system substrate-binding protein
MMPRSPLPDGVDASRSRRAFLGAVTSTFIAAPFSAFAQPQGATLHRIGFLGSESPPPIRRVGWRRCGLRDLGYVEGRNIAIEVRWAEGNYDRLPALAAELIGLKVSVVVTSGTKATRAMTRATSTIPIVVETGDAVALGVVTNLARPGGNVTGWTFFGPESTAKRLELLKEAIPSVTQMAYLVNVADPPSGLLAIETAAKALKVGLSQFRVHGPEEFDSAFAAMVQRHVDAVVVQGDTMFGVNAKAIAALAIKHRLPSAGNAEFAGAGGMIGSGGT